LKHATSTIPIVAAGMGDPVADGLVASLAVPGGNVTGNTLLAPHLVAKNLALLQEAVPGVTRVAGLWQPGFFSESTSRVLLQEAEETARALKLQLAIFGVPDQRELEVTFARITASGADGLIVLTGGMLWQLSRQVAALAMRYHLPGVFPARQFSDAGGLLSYGANIPDLCRRVASYADRILKGTPPGSLPVERPTRFDMVVNLRTARELGLSIPPQVLARADDVLE
jgi:putative ABC transport system substrate-binding protein